MSKYILYGGKGGVGKTTCAAATAIALANRGERTLVVSTDPAHSLGESLGVDLGGSPTEIESELWGVEADATSGQDIYRAVVEAIAADLREAGIRLTDEDVERLFTAGFVPGSDELAALQFFDEYGREDEWDRVVFDTAPTGHTLRLLGLPDVLSESLSTAAKLQGQVHQMVDSARSMVFGPAAFFRSDRDADEIETLRNRMERVAALVRDSERTDFRVVLIPETLAIEETRQLVERLRSFDISVETLVVNRVVEEVATDCGRCRARQARHEQNINRIESEFPDFSIQVVPELDGEAYGRPALEQLADEIAI
ncbi:ArsA family ATPase [Halocatena marina]|uniref:ArsA family ATPase n=1 Tax=Halocatena marina TaxID=2934937 RepID=UPI00200E69B9|nr:ArsA family ATPase [Halocatena marina]